MKKITKSMLIRLKNAGLTNKKIAERFEVSEKTIQRLNKAYNIKLKGHKNHNVEKFQRELYLKLGNTGGKVADMFGITRQAVLK